MSSAVVAKTPSTGPPKDIGFPSGWPSAKATSKPAPPGERSTPSNIGSTSARARAPRSVARRRAAS